MKCLWSWFLLLALHFPYSVVAFHSDSFFHLSEFFSLILSFPFVFGYKDYRLTQNWMLGCAGFLEYSAFVLWAAKREKSSRVEEVKPKFFFFFFNLKDGCIVFVGAGFWNRRRRTKPDETTTFFNIINTSTSRSTPEEKEKPTWNTKQVSKHSFIFEDLPHTINHKFSLLTMNYLHTLYAYI